MNQIILDKTTKADMTVYRSAVQFYGQWLSGMVELENTQQIHLQYSILWVLNHEIEKYFFKRENPINKAWKLEPHTGYILKDALMYLMNSSSFSLEKAQATRLFNKVHCQLPVAVDGDCYIISH